MNENDDKIFKKIGAGILAQIISYSVFTLAFFLSVYNDRLLYVIAFGGIFAIALFSFFRKQKTSTAKDKILSFLYVIASLILLFLPFNIFYEILTNFLIQNPTGLKNSISWNDFWMYFGLLTFFAFISEFIIATMYYYFAEKDYPVESGYGVWDYFLVDMSWKKGLILITLLMVSAVAEEIIFRYFLLNIFLMLGLYVILAVAIASILFGLAHYGNGGWIYCVNSTFAGIFFCLAFLQHGIMFAWALHFFWNFIVIIQMFLPKLYQQSEESK